MLITSLKKLESVFLEFYKAYRLDIRGNLRDASIINIAVDYRYRFFFLFRLTSSFYRAYGNNLFVRIMARIYLREQRLCGVELPFKATVLAPIRIPHLNSIVVHENVTLGRGVSLLPFCTIGNKSRQSYYEGARVGSYVSIGSGAKVIGDVRIDAFTVIGANSVVSQPRIYKGVYAVELAKKIK